MYIVFRLEIVPDNNKRQQGLQWSRFHSKSYLAVRLGSGTFCPLKTFFQVMVGTRLKQGPRIPVRVSVLAGLVFGLVMPVMGGEEMIPATTWPASWFHAPKTASESGLKEYHEAPVLAERVKAGTLPPVKLRLPDDPVVIEPAGRIGRYGGTARVFNQDFRCLLGIEPLLTVDPLVRDVLPNLVWKWEFSDGGKVLTLFLRKGVKWSDGHPLTSGDFVFWYEHICCNSDITPMMERPWKNARVTAPDDFTVRYEFVSPYPELVRQMAQHGDEFCVPAHFLRTYHPDFVPKADLETMARRDGFISWMSYFDAARGGSTKYFTGDLNGKSTGPVVTPVLKPYVLSRQSPTLRVYERNPYYSKVDPAGNQLPYMDRVYVMVASSVDVIVAKACTGQASLVGNPLKTTDIPLFKTGEKAGKYKTYIWNRLHGVDVVIQPNLTSPDKGLRALFQDLRFRKALSLSINRQEINTIVYFGRAVPRQTTVIPTSKFYEKSFADAYIEYKPDVARSLLDEMGVVDRNGDGFRERPDGGRLHITLEWYDIETPKGITMELVVEYWRKIGLDVALRQVNSELQASRAKANMMDMTVWHADRCSDILFPSEPYWFVPMNREWEECHWSEWVLWYQSGGQQGEEPIAAVRQLLDWWGEMTSTPDEARQIELGKNILRSQAENLWTIGTVGLAPQPLIVSDELKNVPLRGFWGWDNRWTLPYHPETWYLEPEEPK